MIVRRRLLAMFLSSIPLFARAEEVRIPITLIDLQGTVQVRLSDQEPWTDGEEEQSILAGESIQTGADSSAHIRFGNEGLLEITAQTSIRAMPTTLLTLLLQNGTLVGQVNPKRKAPSNAIQMEFQTPTMVVGIRGTEFAIQAHTRITPPLQLVCARSTPACLTKVMWKSNPSIPPVNAPG